MVAMFRRMFGLTVAAGLLAALAGGCSNENKVATANPRTGGLWALKVTSSAFGDGEAIPRKYAADGGNLSPALKWNSGPSGTKEFVVIVQDANSSGDRPATQWLVYGIPANVTSLPEGSAGGFKEGKNHKGQVGYAGPELKGGEEHKYFFQVLALDRPLTAEAGADPQELAKMYDGWILAKGQLIGTYKQP